MAYGEVRYDEFGDMFQCEFPVIGKNGKREMCGKWCQDLVRHITQAHGITADEYKKLMGLDLKEPLMSKRTRHKLRRINKEKKLYKNLKPNKYKLKKGETTIQEYERSEQTKKRLRNLKNKDR